jgi:glycerophosphoryl diester phosphodiesterase
MHVWTLNDARSIARALDRGVDGVMTDRPELLKRVLAERGLWH